MSNNNDVLICQWCFESPAIEGLKVCENCKMGIEKTLDDIPFGDLLESLKN